VGRGLLAALALLPLASASASAQESVFALQFLGVSEETGDGRARSLGVLGVGLDETRTAIVLNPATLGGANHMSLSVMAVAGSRETTDMDSQQRFGMARFPQLRGALPLFGKVVFTTGFMAMRNFRGEFTLEPDQIDDLTYAQRFERDGTLYVVPVGLAGSLGPLLRVGATADFMLGTIDEAWITEGESLLPLSSRRRDRLSGITATLGVLLQPTPWLELGATYSPEFDVQRDRVSCSAETTCGGSGRRTAAAATKRRRLATRSAPGAAWNSIRTGVLRSVSGAAGGPGRSTSAASGCARPPCIWVSGLPSTPTWGGSTWRWNTPGSAISSATDCRSAASAWS
jgi:hypothetical protein